MSNRSLVLAILFLAVVGIISRAALILAYPMDTIEVMAGKRGDQYAYFEVARTVVSEGEFRGKQFRAYRPPGYPAYLALLSQRDIMGRAVADALPEAAEQGYVALLDEVYRSARPYTAHGAKFVYQPPSGGASEERYVDFVFQPITGGDGTVTGILVQGVDVTARAMGEQALSQSRARLDYATRLSGVGYWYCDLPFDELQWDDRVKDHFFFPPESRITIHDFYARIHEEDRALTRAAIETSVNSRTPYDIVYRTVNPETGATRWIRAQGGADYAPDGTPLRFDGVSLDVTAQKTDEQRLSKLNRLLREQDRRKDEFIATLSHELRNPLAPIRAAARVMVTPGISPEQRQQAQAGRVGQNPQEGHQGEILDRHHGIIVP